MKKNQMMALLVVACMGLMLSGCAAKPASSEAEPPSAADEKTSDRPEDDAAAMLPRYRYTLNKVVPVYGRQGVATDGECYWVSGSKSLTKYDKDWNEVCRTDTPFTGYTIDANHIGDIDVYNGELYLSVENFMDGVGTDIQIAVHDAETLALKRTFRFEPESGQLECSGITINPDEQTVWLCSWVGEESGRYLYEYSLETGAYLRRVHLQCPPQWLQGMVYYDGAYYLTADDGTADESEPDHIYRVNIAPGASSATVTLERTLDDVTFQGEIEGISVNRNTHQMLVHYNRGSRIVLGMVKGFYPGYDAEISEVYVYDMAPRDD